MDDRRGIESLGLAGSAAAAGGVAGLAVLTVHRNLDWYRGLRPAPLPAPEVVLGPTWALLYANQAVAAWLVWRGDARRAEYDVPALSSYWVQLALNAAWTVLFFGFRRPALALVDIVVLWVAIAVTIREFARRHRFAAALLLPYLAWVSYAALLNAGVWWRNR